MNWLPEWTGFRQPPLKGRRKIDCYYIIHNKCFRPPPFEGRRKLTIGKKPPAEIGRSALPPETS